MAPQELLDSLHANPFVPFRLRLSNGQTYDIGDPNHMMVGTRFLHIGIPAVPGEAIVDRIIRIDPIHVTEVIPLVSPPQPSQSNGQQP
jgi:hypothetical protein